MPEIEVENDIVKRKCWGCETTIEMTKTDYNRNPKRLCEQCREIRQQIKQAESSIRQNKDEWDWYEGEDTKERILYRKMAYSMTKISLMRELMKKKGILENFEEVMRMPDK